MHGRSQVNAFFFSLNLKLSLLLCFLNRLVWWTILESCYFIQALDHLEIKQARDQTLGKQYHD